jgi:hypothetical protein
VTYMLCRNKVADFERWKTVFASHAEAHRAAGLKLEHLWRSTDDSNNILLLFEVEDLNKALAFINAPEAANAANESGVGEGEYHVLESTEAY